MVFDNDNYQSTLRKAVRNAMFYFDNSKSLKRETIAILNSIQELRDYET